jgi:hypothetical protein
VARLKDDGLAFAYTLASGTPERLSTLSATVLLTVAMILKVLCVLVNITYSKS